MPVAPVAPSGRGALGKFLVILLLIVGAAGAGVFLYLEKDSKDSKKPRPKNDNVTNPTPPSADAAVATTVEDAGKPAAEDAAAVLPDPDEDAMVADIDAAPAEEDAGVATTEPIPEVDAAQPVATVDAGEEVEQVFVQVYSLPDGADCYVDGALTETTPTMIPVTPGKTVQVKLVKNGFKTEEFTLDGKKTKIVARLKRKNGPTPHPTPPNNVPFCSRPENKNHPNCLDKADCRRPENFFKPWCLADQLE
jgi:hypothetical protein